MRTKQEMEYRIRELESILAESILVTSPNEAVKEARRIIPNYNQEHMMVIGLNTAGKVICSKVISSGSLNSSIVDPKILFRNLLLIPRIHSFVMVHNHPSCSLSPSSEDKAITRKIKAGSELLGLLLSDHIIITDLEYHSMREYGEM